MDVGGAALDGVGQDDVDQLDHRRLLDLVLHAGEVEVLLVVQHLEVAAALLEVLHDLLELDGVGGAVVAVDGAADGALGGDHRLDLVAGHELDVVHGEDVRRVDHRHGDGGAGLRDRQDRVLARDVGRDDLEHRLVHFHAIEVDGRDLEVLGEEVDELALGEEAQLDQGGADAPALLALVGQGLLELLGGDLAGVEEHLAELVGGLLPGAGFRRHREIYTCRLKPLPV